MTSSEAKILIQNCAIWFRTRGITDAVVGYSGGLDSSTTAALISSTGVNLHLVVAEAPHQKYSSPFGGAIGAAQFAKNCHKDVKVYHIPYSFTFTENAANEAAAPIQRVAIFYGITAQLREDGKKAVVVGTANFDEAAYLGFWGKASDGNQDFYPISHLHKSEVEFLARYLEIPDEIINAVPSGDLLFQNTNDLKMTGAKYADIEAISRAMEESKSPTIVFELIRSVSDPKIFCQQIRQNNFKYKLSFNGFHLSSRLEEFRQNQYGKLLEILQRVEESI
jgi:NAD+ synthetase